MVDNEIEHFNWEMGGLDLTSRAGWLALEDEISSNSKSQVCEDRSKMLG